MHEEKFPLVLRVGFSNATCKGEDKLKHPLLADGQSLHCVIKSPLGSRIRLVIQTFLKSSHPRCGDPPPEFDPQSCNLQPV